MFENIEQLYLKYNIDSNRLVRDYIINPLGYIRNGSIKYREKPFKEDLEYLYIELNMSINDLSLLLSMNKRMLQKELHNHSIKKDRRQVYNVQKKTMIETMGVENPFQLKTVKEKIAETNLKKYGNESFVRTKLYKDMNRKSRIEKYGKDLYNRNKYKETCMNRYGVENSSQSHYDELHKKMVNDRDYVAKFIYDNNVCNIKDFAEKSGLCYDSARILMHKFDFIKDFDYTASSQESEIQKWLDYNFVDYLKHQKIENKELDIFIPKINMAIEFNGNYWHSSAHKNMYYHYDKTVLCNTNGIRLFHIFEYEWNNNKQNILNRLKKLLDIGIGYVNFDDCELLIDGYNYSLIYDGEVVQKMVIVNIDDNNYEIIENESFGDVIVNDGDKELLNRFIKDYEPESIIIKMPLIYPYLNDYETLGFKHIGYDDPDYVLYKSNKIYDKNDIDELSENVFRIYDCGKKILEWK